MTYRIYEAVVRDDTPVLNADEVLFWQTWLSCIENPEISVSHAPQKVQDVYSIVCARERFQMLKVWRLGSEYALVGIREQSIWLLARWTNGDALPDISEIKNRISKGYYRYGIEDSTNTSMVIGLLWGVPSYTVIVAAVTKEIITFLQCGLFILPLWITSCVVILFGSQHLLARRHMHKEPTIQAILRDRRQKHIREPAIVS